MHVDISEDTLLKQLRRLADRTSEKLQWDNLTLDEALDLIQRTRVQAEQLIPDQMELYQLIYDSRFRRLLEQFVVPRQVGLQFNWHKPY